MATPIDPPPAQPDPPAQKNCASQSVPEADLARALGVARDDLKKLRAQLTAGEHWTGSNGAPILITPAGQARLQLLLKPAAPSAGDGTPDTVQTAVIAIQRPDRYTPLLVLKIGGARLLLARCEPASPPADPPAAPAPEVRVMVKASANFLPGMRLAECEPSQTAGVYYYHGRLPRQKGRW